MDLETKLNVFGGASSGQPKGKEPAQDFVAGSFSPDAFVNPEGHARSYTDSTNRSSIPSVVAKASILSDSKSNAIDYDEELNRVRQRFNQGELFAFGKDSTRMFSQLSSVLEQQRALAKDHLYIEEKASEQYRLRNPKKPEHTEKENGLGNVDNAAMFSSLLGQVKALNSAITNIRLDMDDDQV
eukprot:CFRG5672T1